MPTTIPDVLNVDGWDEPIDPMGLTIEDLTELSTSDVMKALALVTRRERALSAEEKKLADQVRIIQEVVIQRMAESDTQSTRIMTDDGDRMTFTLTTKNYPRMLVPSSQVVDALQRLAMRLDHDGRHHDAQEILNVLTIKGQSLAPVLKRWMEESDTDDPLPEELRDVVEISTQYTLYKRS